MFCGFTTVSRDVNETRVGVSGDMDKAKAPKGWYISYIHLLDIPWPETTRVDTH
jgi:hypothetical protein